MDKKIYNQWIFINKKFLLKYVCGILLKMIYKKKKYGGSILLVMEEIVYIKKMLI